MGNKCYNREYHIFKRRIISFSVVSFIKNKNNKNDVVFQQGLYMNSTTCVKK